MWGRPPTGTGGTSIRMGLIPHTSPTADLGQVPEPLRLTFGGGYGDVCGRSVIAVGDDDCRAQADTHRTTTPDRRRPRAADDGVDAVRLEPAPTIADVSASLWGHLPHPSDRFRDRTNAAAVRRLGSSPSLSSQQLRRSR